MGVGTYGVNRLGNDALGLMSSGIAVDLEHRMGGRGYFQSSGFNRQRRSAKIVLVRRSAEVWRGNLLCGPRNPFRASLSREHEGPADK